MKKIVVSMLLAVAMLLAALPVSAQDYYACDIASRQIFVDGDGIRTHDGRWGIDIDVPIKHVEEDGELVATDVIHYRMDGAYYVYASSRMRHSEPVEGNYMAERVLNVALQITGISYTPGVR